MQDTKHNMAPPIIVVRTSIIFLFGAAIPALRLRSEITSISSLVHAVQPGTIQFRGTKPPAGCDGQHLGRHCAGYTSRWACIQPHRPVPQAQPSRSYCLLTPVCGSRHIAADGAGDVTSQPTAPVTSPPVTCTGYMPHCDTILATAQAIAAAMPDVARVHHGWPPCPC